MPRKMYIPAAYIRPVWEEAWWFRVESMEGAVVLQACLTADMMPGLRHGKYIPAAYVHQRQDLESDVISDEFHGQAAAGQIYTAANICRDRLASVCRGLSTPRPIYIVAGIHRGKYIHRQPT